MLPLIPFAAGLITGAVAVRLLKTGKARAGLDKAQQRVREATASSLAAIENASARARSKLETPAAAAAPEAVETPPTPKAAARPRRKAPAQRKTRPKAATPSTKEE